MSLYIPVLVAESLPIYMPTKSLSHVRLDAYLFIWCVWCNVLFLFRTEIPACSVEPQRTPHSAGTDLGLQFARILFIAPISQQSIARKKSSDGKIEYIMASMLIVLLDVW